MKDKKQQALSPSSVVIVNEYRVVHYQPMVGKQVHFSEALDYLLATHPALVKDYICDENDILQAMRGPNNAA